MELATQIIYIVVGISSIGVAGYLVLKAQSVFYELLAVHKADAMPLSNVIENTPQKVTGIAHTYEDTVQSSLRNQESLLYSSRIEDTSSVIKETVYDDDDSVPFIIEESRNRLLVDPRHMTPYLKRDIVPINTEAVQSIIYQKSLSNMSAKDVQVSEGLIQPSDSVFIYGELSTRSDPTLGKDIQSTPEKSTIISNMNTTDMYKLLGKKLSAYLLGVSLLLISAFGVLGMGLELV